MTNDISTIDNQGLATMPLPQAIEAYAPNFAAVLPPNLPVDHFKRMVVTAININPDLWSADRRTLLNACVKCASDGLLPDGREAALVVFRTKIKDRQGREHWIDAVQYMPMIAGVRKRMRNSGDVVSATAEVVYRNDRFRYRLGDEGAIEHEPPSLDQDRGDPIGAYAIIRLASGEMVREVMGFKDIERARSFSRAKDGPAWKNFWGEMARKTVLRRASKAVPQAAALERLLLRDEESPELPPAESLPLVPPRPRREDFDGGEQHADAEPVGFAVEAETAEPPPADAGQDDRADFWKDEKLVVVKTMGDRGPDWRRTTMAFLYWINDAWTAAEIRKLLADSKPTLDGLKLGHEGYWKEIMMAAEARISDLDGR